MQYIWNPNDPCVDWSEKAFFWSFFLGGFYIPKIEV